MGQAFSITLVFPDLAEPGFPAALALARQSPGFETTGAGPQARHRASFAVGDTPRLLEVFEVVKHAEDLEILVDDQPVPYGRELWIPLVSLCTNS